ncbi:hypothetical protein tinsulaeT_20210 [Thalassotalea insulae]|uniref:Uncharacterized protein n=1 Tax=Thalassotalea insulae TaxID=2056778 RepID=A0ABQ6GWZ4_9GAMM|nr:hypothetical protein [Thalassotalea insulae]GLX78681.1 hypothetical protein tinsulaeT_20210 [Thalassotalea insulae]
MIDSVTMENSSTFSLPKQDSLNEQQQLLVTETLKQFDADSLSEQDALAIVEQFSQAGIRPGKALAQTMAIAGFDAAVVGELAGVKRKNGLQKPPAPQHRQELGSMVDYLAQLMKEKLSASETGSLTDDEKQAILSQVLEKFGLEDHDSIINTRV